MNSDPLKWIDQELEELEQSNLRRYLQRRESPQVAGLVQLDGDPFRNFGSNDYLGISSDARLVDAVKKQVGYVGWGSGASPLVSGRGTLHCRLERELAEFEGTEAALLFSSGYAANIGAITALIGRDDHVFSDAKNHASIIDGCRLSSAATHIYRHADVHHLAQLIRDVSQTLDAEAARFLIVTDSLFSMDGDLAPLPQLAEVASEFGAMLMIDEAHATGVFGKSGRGVAEHYEVEQQIDVRVGTLSKALGSHGGFVAGSQSLIDWLSNRARPYVFSTAFPEVMAAPSIESLRIVQLEPERRSTLLENAKYVRGELGKQSWQVEEGISQIIPVRVGSEVDVMSYSGKLREQGIFVPGIRPPSVPQGESLLRISLNYGHDRSSIDFLLNAMKELR